MRYRPGGLANTSLFRSEGQTRAGLEFRHIRVQVQCLEHTAWLTKLIDELSNAGFMCLVTSHVLFGGGGGVV